MTTYNDLPSSLREIADSVGVENALKLSKTLGGRRFRIPLHSTVDDNHPIVKAIGIEPASRMIRDFRGIRIEIPVFGRKLERDDEIRQAHADGESIPSLADRYRITERWVRDILRR